MEDQEKMLKRLQDVANNTDGAIIVLDDSDVALLSSLRAQGQMKELNDHLEEKLKRVLM